MVMADQVDLTAIVVNWNTQDLLRRCLASLVSANDGVRLEIIVVDNGSRDGSQEMLRSEFPQVRVLANTINTGFARANNQGAAQAGAPLLLLLNSDAAVRPGALQAIGDFMSAHPAIGIAGLQLLNDDLTLQPSGRRFPSLLSTVIGLLPVRRQWRIAYERRRNARDYSQVSYVDEVSGAAMVVRRDLWQQLQGMDECFFFFGEDIDLCWRASEHGAQVVYLPLAQAIHSWGGARARTPSIRQGLMSQRAQYVLLQRHKPLWQATVLWGFLTGMTLARLVRVAIQIALRPAADAHGQAHLYARELLWLARHGPGDSDCREAYVEQRP